MKENGNTKAHSISHHETSHTSEVKDKSKQLSTIELFKEDMNFVAGHYTIFSAQERERLHGHTFNVYAAITAEVDDNGLAFDYACYKDKLRKLCQQLNEYFLIAANSPHQRIEEQGDQVAIHFAQEIIPFLKKDIKLLPLRNITVEELARWFILQLTHNPQELTQYGIHHLLIKVFSGPGQSGSAHWP